MKTYRCMQVREPKKPLEMAEKEIPELKKGEVLIKVKACGICHSDAFTKEGLFPGISYPRVPGHEIAGVIEAVNEAPGKKVGDRIGVGWHGGNCGHCCSCRSGDFITCTAGKVPGVSYDGGYAEYMVAPHVALAKIPDGLSFLEASPLMCAGVTTFNALRNSGTCAGSVVAILGVGGLGHLAIQYAAHMGFHTVAIARGQDKEPLAKELGASTYIDSLTQNVGAELQKLGGSKVILSTVTDAKSMSQAISGLSIDGKLILLGVSSDPLEVPCLPLIGGRRQIIGWPSGTSMDSEDTLAFSAFQKIKPSIEVFPLEKAEEAYQRMLSGKARFRVVLTME